MDPGMDADLVPVSRDAAHLLLMQQSRDGRIEESDRNRLALHQGAQTRHALAIAVLTLTDAHRARIGVAQRDRLVIGVERERDRATRPVGPGLRPQAAAGPRPLDDAAPNGFLP